MKIGFLGAGNMASAILSGMVHSGKFKAENLVIFDRHEEKMQALQKELGVQLASSQENLLKGLDVLVLAIKPKGFAEVLPQIAHVLQKKNIFLISIAAGKTIEFIERYTGALPMARVMPNINATVFASMTAYCFSDSRMSNLKRNLVKELCESFGDAMELPEEQFPLFGVIAGSAPAFTYMYIDELARAAVAHGMKKDVALKIAAQMTLGSAKQILESEKHPYELIDNVCSPGGTTIEGMKSLDADAFASTIQHAVDKTLEKDSKI